MISCPKSTPIHYTHTDPDVVLMLRVRDGDPEAFRQLVVLSAEQTQTFEQLKGAPFEMPQGVFGRGQRGGRTKQ